MFNISYEDIISRIKEEKQLSEEEINQRIKDKLRQLSDLISKEGAAHIVANELGVKVVDVAKEIKVQKLLSGMSNVILTGKVVRINDVIIYMRNGKEGKVCSLILGDETGLIRVVFWDLHHIEKIENGSITDGTILKIKNAYVKSNNGYKELHLGNRGEIEINPPGVDMQVNETHSFDFVKKKIVEVQEGDMNIGIYGTIVQIFEPHFYEACSFCGKKLEHSEDGFLCRTHGRVTAELIPVLNLFLDDGTESLRAVAFRQQVETLLGLTKEGVLEMREDGSKFDHLRGELLGKQVILIGRIIKNEIFDRKEMMIQRFIEPQPDELIKEMER